MKEEEKEFGITEKGILLCELWQVEKITIVSSIVIILLQTIMLTIMLIKL